MYRVSTMETNSPKQITVPKGPHRGERLKIMGMTPTAAAAEVRKMGLILRFPAARAASFVVIPWFSLNSRA